MSAGLRPASSNVSRPSRSRRFSASGSSLREILRTDCCFFAEVAMGQLSRQALTILALPVVTGGEKRGRVVVAVADAQLHERLPEASAADSSVAIFSHWA